MVVSAALMLRERGVAGTSFARVIERADAPRGSIGHHFPGGKREMIAAAVAWAGAAAAAAMRRSLDRGASAAEIFGGVCGFYRRALLDSGFAAGCPVGAVAQEKHADPELRAAALEVFKDWRSVLTAALMSEGRPQGAAEELADLCIAAIEGALLLCRVDGSTESLDRVKRQITTLLA